MLTLGATLRAVTVGGADVVLGCAGVEDYLAQDAFLGAVVGRYANRIAGGRFALDGRAFELTRNEPPNTLHGGVEGFDRRLWAPLAYEQGERATLLLGLTSEDGDQGFPGRLDARVRYTVGDGALRIDYEATADRPTVVNLTSHAYWNLAGAGAIDGHELWVDAGRYTPVDDALIPTGELRDVAGTEFDLRTRPVRLEGRAYDVNLVLGPAAGLRLAARLRDPGSGRTLELLTTAPGLQVYTGDLLDGTIVDRTGRRLGPRAGLALEPQAFPDAPNRPSFPSAVLRPGSTYRSTTVYRLTPR